MLYLYAIAAGLGDIAALRGVQGEALATLPFHDAVVVSGEVAQVPGIDPAALKAQDALVRELHARAAALLPMRFGTAVADAEALTRALDSRVIDRLEAVRACEQMTLRVVGGAGGAERAGGAEGAQSGTAYLMARAGKLRASPELDLIARAAAHVVRGVRVEPANQHGVHGSVYHLIERGRADDYRAAIEQAARDVRDVRVIITGPSPAYAFA